MVPCTPGAWSGRRVALVRLLVEMASFLSIMLLESSCTIKDTQCKLVLKVKGLSWSLEKDSGGLL